MGKKTSPLGGKKGIQLGRAIIKDRFGKGRGKNRKGDPTMVLKCFYYKLTSYKYRKFFTPVAHIRAR
jgi:hypothetical protein